MFHEAFRKCIQLLYSYQVPSHKQVLKGPITGGAKFFQTVNLNFPKEDHMNSFYTKNHPHSINYLENITQNVDFMSKRANLDQKGSKMGVARFLLDFKPQFFKVDHKIGFYTIYQQN